SYGLPRDWECLTLAGHPTEPQVVLGGSGDLAWLMKERSEDPFRPLHTNLGSFIRKACFLSPRDLAMLGANGVEVWNPISCRRTDVLPVAQGKRALAVRKFHQ